MNADYVFSISQRFSLEVLPWDADEKLGILILDSLQDL